MYIRNNIIVQLSFHRRSIIENCSLIWGKNGTPVAKYILIEVGVPPRYYIKGFRSTLT